jgi:hypothetical protein
MTYVFLVKVWGPRYMKHREPMNIRTFLVWYNAAQVVLSTYIFVQVCATPISKSPLPLDLPSYFIFQLLRAGWWNDYSFRCQPVDYTDTPKARLVIPLTIVDHLHYYFYIFLVSDAPLLLALLPQQICRVCGHGKLHVLSYWRPCFSHLTAFFPVCLCCS